MEQVSIFPSRAAVPESLLAALAGLVPVEFRTFENRTTPVPADAVVAFTYERPLTAKRSFIVTRGTGGAVTQPDAKVKFTDSLRLDRRLRGRTLDHESLDAIAPLDVQKDDEVLAYYGNLPVWIYRQRPGEEIDRVSVPLPPMPPSADVFEHLRGYRFIELLPLLHFLRGVTVNSAWQRPPLRACLMFDDPNLHWNSYGFLNYPALIERAKRHNYHISLAMVPLDAWGANGRTVSLFKENPRALSLIVHGNDHTRGELASADFTARPIPLLSQSLKRIHRLERKTGVHVERVIAPPHGACAEALMPSMLSLGFEGACISNWSLRDWNNHRQWPHTFGLRMTEILAGGFPVVPRFRMSDSCIGDIVISAFLDRPIIPVGHHTDAKTGLEILDRLAAVINSFEGIAWGGVESILRSNFLSRRDQDCLQIIPYSRRIMFTVPDGIRTILLQPTEGPAEAQWEQVLITQTQNGTRKQTKTAIDSPIPVVPSDQIEVRWVALGAVDYTNIALPKTPLWSRSRRILCEVRDRSLPLLNLKKARG